MYLVLLIPVTSAAYQYVVDLSAGIIVLDDADSEVDIDESHLQTAAHLRARLKDASEHESRMRSTISSARRFALDLERTGDRALLTSALHTLSHTTLSHFPLHHQA
jgi:hypothetical protein